MKKNICKHSKQFEITLREVNGTEKFVNEYGFGDNPPIIICAKNKKDARNKLKLPKGVKIVSIEKG